MRTRVACYVDRLSECRLYNVTRKKLPAGEVYRRYMSSKQGLEGRIALVTGAARRVGAEIATHLHAAGANVGIHYRHSAEDAGKLVARLNELRPDSAAAFQADLLDIAGIPALVSAVSHWRGGIDILINNASTFYPTPLGEITESHWDDLVGSNLKAPLFLSQAAAASLRERRGSIVNIVDIHAQRPLRDHLVYGTAKAGLAMLTRALAKDLAPDVRVNGVSPGAILWPEGDMSDQAKANILDQVPLERAGDPADIAGCVLYLVRDATYVTGQIVAVDGGRSIGW
jgi:pteridine reductase